MTSGSEFHSGGFAAASHSSHRDVRTPRRTSVQVNTDNSRSNSLWEVDRASDGSGAAVGGVKDAFVFSCVVSSFFFFAHVVVLSGSPQLATKDKSQGWLVCLPCDVTMTSHL